MANNGPRKDVLEDMRKNTKKLIKVDARARGELESLRSILSGKTVPMIKKDSKLDELRKNKLLSEAQIVLNGIQQLSATTSLRQESEELTEVARHWLRLNWGIHDAHPNAVKLPDGTFKMQLNPYKNVLREMSAHITELKKIFGVEEEITQAEQAELLRLK